MKINNIGQIINVKDILNKHKNEESRGTNSKICEYLNCNLGEVYVCFDDINKIDLGQLCRIKEDIFLSLYFGSL